jgi:hypothetical protein
MKPSPVLVSISGNEVGRMRADMVRKAIREDDRFDFLQDHKQEPPFDLRFVSKQECPQCHGVSYPNEENEDGEECGVICGICTNGHGIIRKTFHVELKDFSEDSNSDYLASILNGHLWAQCLAARELGEPLAIVILGDDNDVGAAIRKAAGHGNQGHRVDPEKLMEYFRMVEGFEANAIALGIQVWRLKTDPYKRMLLRVRKLLKGGDLSGFAPSPAAGERQAVGLSILAGRGVGPKKARSMLEYFDVALDPMYSLKLDRICELEDVPGIGPKLAAQIRKNIKVVE